VCAEKRRTEEIGSSGYVLSPYFFHPETPSRHIPTRGWRKVPTIGRWFTKMDNDADKYKVWRVLGEAPTGFKCNMCGSEAKWVIQSQASLEKKMVCEDCRKKLEGLDLDDFKFQQLKSLVDRLREAGLSTNRFIKIMARGKNPVMPEGFYEKLLEPDDPTFIQHLVKGGNYGVAAGSGLVLIESDGEPLASALASRFKTFTVISGGSRMPHFYIAVDDLPADTSKAIPLYYGFEEDMNGNLAHKHIGMVKIENGYCVGPGSIHPSGGLYTIGLDAPIARVSWKDLLEVLKPFMLESFREATERIERTNAPEKRLNISIEKLLEVYGVKGLKKSGEQLYGPHPIHGSTTGRNFWVHIGKGVWYCFRCQSGGGPVSLLAVLEGLITCDEAGKGLDRELYRKALEKAVEKGLLAKEALEELPEELEELPEKPEELIMFFTEAILERFTVKHFIKGGYPIDLYMWLDGRYVPCEEWLRAFIEAEAGKYGLSRRVRTYIVNETVEKVKRKTYFELKEEPLKIAFKNCVLDWKAFLEGDLEKAIIPLEETREEPVFHLIPHRLDVELLKRLYGSTDLSKTIEEEAPTAVKAFKAWVGDRWILLFELIGYTLYPGYPLHKAVMLVGEGSNGKSTYLRLIAEILSRENVVGKSLQELCYNRFAASELYHKLANIYPDIPKTALRETGAFKALTGEDMISPDRKFKTSIPFVNYAKLLFSANELPEVTDMTFAFWRRWLVIEFPNKFPENPKFFEETFTEEVIEKIIVLSLLAFRNALNARKFSVEASEADYKEKWLRSANTIYNYVKTGLEEKWLELNKDSYVPCDTLYMDYQEWCDGNDLKAEGKATFTKELERLFGIQKKRKREGKLLIYVYVGVKLKSREGEGSEDKGQNQLDSNI